MNAYRLHHTVEVVNYNENRFGHFTILFASAEIIVDSDEILR